MDDVFVGAAPPVVWSVIALPRVPHVVSVRVELASTPAEDVEILHVPFGERPGAVEQYTAGVHAPEEEEAGPVAASRITDEEELVLRIPPVATVREPLRPEDVWKELLDILAAEDARERDLQVRAHVRRRERRAELRIHLGDHSPSSSDRLHARLRRSARPLPSSRPTTLAVPARAIRGAPVPASRMSRHDRRTHKSSGRGTPARSPSSDASRVGLPIRQVGSAVVARRASDRRELWGMEEVVLAPLIAPPVPWREVRTQRERRPVHRFTQRVLWQAAALAGGAAVLGGLVGLLGSLAAVPRVARTVSSTASEGVGHLKEGVRAIAVANVAAGEEELGQAAVLFSQAQEELARSTSVATRLLSYLDPADRYASGTRLLEAGETLATFGEDAAALVKMFDGRAGEKRTVTDTLEASLPALGRLSAGLQNVEGLLLHVSASAVPSDMRGELARLQGTVGSLAKVLSGIVTSHDVLLELLGARHDRQYLVVFVNNRELRPGGGFIGSFALVDVSRGEVRQVHVDTIYNPDGQLTDFIVPPVPLQKLTDRWYTRDANWFADFRKNAAKVSSLFERSGGPTVDGVVAVTPSVLERLLRVTGPIDMPAYGLTVTADNVVDETQRLVTYTYDREKNEPKAFIADLLPVVLQRVTTLPRERWGDLVGVLAGSLKEKQVLLWLRDGEAEQKVVSLGWAGAVESTDGDYLMRVEANIGGHKTDELIEQSVEHDISIGPDGRAIATLVTTRRHQGSPAGRPGWNPDEDWYRKPNRVYERTLVPRGSVLLEARGFTRAADVPAQIANVTDYSSFTVDPDIAALESHAVTDESGTTVTEEEGKTSFGNWVVTHPGETTVTLYRYRLPLTIDLASPFRAAFRYSLLVQSQPGHQPVTLRSTVHLPPGTAIVWSGPDSGVTQSGERQATFTSVASGDRLWGIVAEQL